MRIRFILSIVLSLAVITCGGGGGGGGNAATSPATAPTPTGLTVTATGLDQILLTWTAPTAGFDGYELESKIGDGAFTKIHTGLIPSTYTNLYLTFSPTAPDATDYAFRLRTARGTEFSPYSNSVTYSRRPNAPSQANATYDWANSVVVLNWNRNTASADGLRIERAECSAYGSVTGTWTSLPLSDPQASTYRDGGVSPDLYYTYRITNLKGVQASQPSINSQPVFTGLVSVTWVNASYDATQGGMLVSWGSSTSTQPDGVRLERSDSDAYGNSLGNWTEVSMPSGFHTSFLDQSVQEGGYYLYRVTYLYGATTTTPSTMYYGASVPLLPPVTLQVSATASGLQLTWQNRSTAANQIVVRRTPNAGFTSDVAILSPSTSSYLDPVTSLGYYTYTVVAKNSTQEAPSGYATAATLNPPGALVLIPTGLNLPTASDAALRPSGGWAFATLSPLGVLSNNDPWPATFPGDASRESSPLIQVDRQGWPHAVYATPASGGSALNLIHLWYNGTAWASETMATASIPWSSANSGWTYHLDSTGVPHVLLDHVTASQPYGGSTASLSYLHKVNGSWVEESLASLSPSVSNIGSFHITLDSSDTPHILLGNWGSVIDYVLTGAGTWTASTPPTGTIQAGWYDFLDSAWVDGSNGWIFFEQYVGGNILEHGLWVIQLKAGVWQSPVLLGSRVHDGASTTASAAISPDQSRVAIVFNTSAGVKTYHQALDGWHETLVAPYTSSYPPLLRIGFDETQKLHVLNLTNAGLTDYHE